MIFQKFGRGRGANGNFYRKTSGLINVILVLHQLFILCSEAYYLDNNPYRHKKVLGPKASYVVEWSINWKDNSVTFQVSAETKGWVGFGLSRDGRMSGSDVIIGGVSPSGKPYFDDAHVGKNRSIQVDHSQDWKLIGAWEKGKRTYLTLKRPLDTCDENDYQITKDLVVLIWAFGETDEVQYHQSHGTLLLGRLSNFCDLLLNGKAPDFVLPVLYGASLYALNKKDLSIRPIAVGCTFRRLVSKIACARVAEKLGSHLKPKQLGFATKGGEEAGAHAARAFINSNHSSPNVFLKLDFENAFNELERDPMLLLAYEQCPEIYPILKQCYFASTG